MLGEKMPERKICRKCEFYSQGYSTDWCCKDEVVEVKFSPITGNYRHVSGLANCRDINVSGDCQFYKYSFWRHLGWNR